MFGLCMWLRLDPNFQEWVSFLEIYEFYIGIYILLAASIFIVVITFIGCGVALMEHILGLYIVRHKKNNLNISIKSVVYFLKNNFITYFKLEKNISYSTFFLCMKDMLKIYHLYFKYAGLQLFSYVLGLVGTAILLDYSTYDSKIQPLIRRSMTALINNYQDPKATYILQLIQESVRYYIILFNYLII